MVKENLKISNFTIKKLFGYMDINIPIKDNKVVIIGANGTGKTTILTMLYYVITGNRIKLLDFDFKEVSITIDNEEFKVIRENLIPYAKGLDRIISKLPSRHRREIKENRDIVESLLSANNYEEMFPLSRMLRVHIRDLELIKEELLSNNLIDKKSIISKIEEKTKKIGKIHFLPTFRRIEKDFKDFIEFSDDEENFIHRQRLGFRDHSGLINFGMWDVLKKIEKSLDNLKEISRKKFRDLAANHFKQILNFDNSKSQDLLDKVKEYENKEITRILNRIEDSDFSSEDKKSLMDSVISLQEKETPSTRELISAKFFLSIKEIDDELTKKEENIYNFAKVCTEYLQDTNKEVKYDNQNYTLEILSEEKKAY